MDTRSITAALVAIMLSGTFSAVYAQTLYSSSPAVSYAKKNYDSKKVPYKPVADDSVKKPASGTNPFGDFSYLDDGGNCANFVSQCIMAGLTGETDAVGVHSKRKQFIADQSVIKPARWFYIKDQSPEFRGEAFTDASDLADFAATNLSSYRGLHFSSITSSTSSEDLKVSKIQKGDVLFMDFEGNGSIDHATLVTDVKKSNWWDNLRNGKNGYYRIQLTYQSNDQQRMLHLIKKDLPNATFKVFRPLDYNTKGKKL